jgi:hypothetical protein
MNVEMKPVARTQFDSIKMRRAEHERTRRVR